MQMILVGRQYFDYVNDSGQQVKAVKLYLSYEQPGTHYDGIIVSNLYVAESNRPEFYAYCLSMKLGGVYEPQLTFNPQKNTSYIIGFEEVKPIDISAEEIVDSFEMVDSKKK